VADVPIVLFQFIQEVLDIMSLGCPACGTSVRDYGNFALTGILLNGLFSKMGQWADDMKLSTKIDWFGIIVLISRP